MLILEVALVVHGHRYFLIMRDFAYDRLRSSPSWFFVQREANNNKTALFTVFRFRAIWTEEWNMTWSIAHEANRCSFWTSSTGVSWKRPFLCIMCNLDHNFHTEMRIYVAQLCTQVWKVHFKCHI